MERQHTDPLVSYSARFKGCGKEQEGQMFGKPKGNSHQNDRLLPQAPQLQNLPPASLAESNSRKSPASVPA